MPSTRPKASLREFAWGAMIAALATAVCHAMSPWFQLADLIMVYLLAVVIVSTRFGLYPSIFTAVLSALAFEFFFIPPKLSFAIFDPKHLVTFAVILLVVVTISGITDPSRRHPDDPHPLQPEPPTAHLQSL